jgi:hypothetical protein
MDLNVGSPFCDACFDYVGAILWNAEASRLWNRTLEQIRRRLAVCIAPGPDVSPQGFRLSYLKVAEFQRRGLVHFHVVLLLDGAGEPFSSPPSEFTTEVLSLVIADVVRGVSISTPHGSHPRRRHRGDDGRVDASRWAFIVRRSDAISARHEGL